MSELTSDDVLLNQGWLQGYVIGGGGVKANLTNSRRSMLRFDSLESVNVEVWPARVGQYWGLPDSSRLMLRFDRLESVSVEVWPTRVGRCWGLTNSSRSVLRYDRLESVNVEVWSTWILLLNKILALAIFDGPIQSGFDQLSQDLTNSVSNIGGGVSPPPPPPLEPSLCCTNSGAYVCWGLWILENSWTDLYFFFLLTPRRWGFISHTCLLGQGFSAIRKSFRIGHKPFYSQVND